MLPIRSILHATDFSERSWSALQLSCALARDYGARLVILNVVSPPASVYGEVVAVPDPVTLAEQAQTQLEGLDVPATATRVDRRLAEGDPVSEILRVAHEMPADLIVMGTHGRTGLARLLMGSVAEQVVRQANCPVLTVRTPFAEVVNDAEVAPSAPVQPELVPGATA